MRAYYSWLYRRLRRTAWLLCHGETRGSIIRHLVAHSIGAALVHGRGYARAHLRRRELM